MADDPAPVDPPAPPEPGVPPDVAASTEPDAEPARADAREATQAARGPVPTTPADRREPGSVDDSPVLQFPVERPALESEVELDEERSILGGIIPGLEGKASGKGSGSKLGQFVAGRMLYKPNFRESQLLNHRAKVAFVDGAALAVPLFYSELGKKAPNKVILDGAMAAMRGAGIVVDSVPVSTTERTKQMDEDREAASMSNEALMARQAERLRLMSGEKKEG